MKRAFLFVLLVASGCNMVRGPRRDHECRSTLRQIMVREFSFQSEQLRYTTHPHELGFAPSTGNRYLYLFDKTGDVTRRDEKPSPSPLESLTLHELVRRDLQLVLPHTGGSVAVVAHRQQGEGRRRAACQRRVHVDQPHLALLAVAGPAGLVALVVAHPEGDLDDQHAMAGGAGPRLVARLDLATGPLVAGVGLRDPPRGPRWRRGRPGELHDVRGAIRGPSTAAGGAQREEGERDREGAGEGRAGH